MKAAFLVTITSPWRIEEIQGLMTAFEYAIFAIFQSILLIPISSCLEVQWKSLSFTSLLIFLNFVSPQESKTSNTCSKGFQWRQKKNNSRICQYCSLKERRGSFKRLSTITSCQAEAFYSWASAHPPRAQAELRVPVQALPPACICRAGRRSFDTHLWDISP